MTIAYTWPSGNANCPSKWTGTTTDNMTFSSSSFSISGTSGTSGSGADTTTASNPIGLVFAYIGSVNSSASNASASTAGVF